MGRHSRGGQVGVYTWACVYVCVCMCVEEHCEGALPRDAQTLTHTLFPMGQVISARCITVLAHWVENSI